MTVIFTPFSSRLNAEVENRHSSTFVRENSVDYDDMFIDLRTDNDAINGNHLQSTSNDADYDQLLGQVEYVSITLQSSILRNPWFLIEVAARLQRNEDEVSITEVPYADPDMEQIYKAHKPDLDPLVPRVIDDHSSSMTLSKAWR
jgi:hypothetical protein